MINQSIVIGVLARDCAKALKENIRRIEELGRYFASYNVVVYENDSADGTKEILKKWADGNKKVVFLSRDKGTMTIPRESDKIPFPAWSISRIEKMAEYRNLLMDAIRERFRPDLVCIMDIDLFYFSPEGVAKAIENAPENWGSLFANGRQWCMVNRRKQFFPTQYDTYAFLEKGKDFRQASSFKFNRDDDLFKGYMMHRLLCSTYESYVPCESAFGGLGVYKFECVKDRRYEACVIPEYASQSIALCEHVPFNCGISADGFGNYIAKDMVTVREFWNKKTTRGVAGLFKNSIRERLNEVNMAVKSVTSPKRYTVLTYVFNNYEKVHEVEIKDPEANYILVTDDFLLVSDTWDIVYDPFLEGMSPFDKTFFVRYHCFRYCDTDICLRVDGSIWIKDSLKPLIDTFEQGGYDACLMPHPFHDNFPDEYKDWIKVRHYPRKQAEKCIADMAAKGYDFNYKGLFQACFSIQRRGCQTDEIDKITYNYLKELGQDGKIERLDQIPFSFIMNTRFSNIKILPVSEQILRSYCMQWFEHGGFDMNLNAFYDRLKPDVHYMFNKEVECMYLDTPKDSAVRYEEELMAYIRTLTRSCKKMTKVSLLCRLIMFVRNRTAHRCN